jgi:hypothetical protein
MNVVVAGRPHDAEGTAPRASNRGDERAIEWLLSSSEPIVPWLARRDLLDGGSNAPPIDDSPALRALFDGQRDTGGFGVHPYAKWNGAHWRLVSMVELGVPPREPRAVAAAETVLRWLTGARHRAAVVTIDGLTRRCASQEGNALAVCSRLGIAGDERVTMLADSLVAWQWPDGGWNCDKRAGGLRSSFHETLAPMWGLHEYHIASGDARAADAARRAAELLLEHHLFRSLGTGEPIHRSWIALHYPPYWHYDILQALVVIARTGLASDARTADAFAVLEQRRRGDGRWRSGGRWWRPRGGGRAEDVVDWSSLGNEMITLNALRARKAAGASHRAVGR